MLNASEIMELQKLAGMEKFSKLTVKQALDREKLTELLGSLQDYGIKRTPGLALPSLPCNEIIADHLIANDVVPVVRCKDCQWAKPYERNDGETGYYCHFCGHAFKYGANWERLYTPIKEADDFCSYGERREGE